MSWLSRTTLERVYALAHQRQTLPSVLATSSSAKSLLACQCLTLRAMSSSVPGPNKRLTDDEIPFNLVRLADSESGSLHPLAPLKTILSSIDRKTHHVELVADRPDPIVRIINKKEAREKYKELRKRAQAAARAQARKEIQVTWSAAPGDLAHKLGKVRQELVGGKKVDLIFTSKSGQVVPTKQEIDARLKGVLDTLTDVGKEYLPRAVRRAMTILYLKPLSQ